MKSHPILFSAPMVRALLTGSKTQTRRIVKPQSAVLTPQMCANMGVKPLPEKSKPVIECPYGNPGDQLWVKETSRLNIGSEESVIQYRADMAIAEITDGWFSDDPVLRRWIWGQSIKPEGWRPSIHMPRRASRITLEITSARVERLHEISEQDAMAEGVNWKEFAGLASKTARKLYRELWESINGAGSWDANPWVWVVDFLAVQNI